MEVAGVVSFCHFLNFVVRKDSVCSFLSLTNLLCHFIASINRGHRPSKWQGD